ncbi:MAG: rod shape-determining protein MreC [Cytophagales bacterium]|nr:rod shape-determining protein MreC [Cytophagales bacterium]
MLRLLNFLFHYRAFLTFLSLEIFCAWLWVGNSQYQNTIFFNTSNRMVAEAVGTTHRISEYVSLRKTNEELSEENAQLRTLLLQLNRVEASSLPGVDSLVRYEFVSARVINNSVARFKNFITIDRGEDAGIRPGMAVISTAGAVGKVKSVSAHFSVITSLLNIDEQVSSVISRTGNFATTQWDGTDPRTAQLLYVPRHVKLLAGDTIVTSGYNAVFPEGILIGTVKEARLNKEALFYEVRVELAQDFSSLYYVRIVRSELKSELDSLERVTIGKQP